jgi:cyclic pyranopterin phosphate synthase
VIEQVLKDSYNRAIRDLRVSVTDRCNFRCFYCLPHGEPRLAPKEELLTYEEIEKACRIFVSLGIEKIRLTGGEPLLRRDIDTLMRKIASIPGVKDLALTTNGYFLAEQAHKLKAAGLKRVTISLDSLKPEVFRRSTGRDALARVRDGIAASQNAGLAPLKINAVIVRDHNEDEIVEMVAFARTLGAEMRFIEYMPLDSAHNWSFAKVVTGREIRKRIEERFPLVPVYKEGAPVGSETASRYLFADGMRGEVGIIAPVTEPFCGACSRIRLTSDGQIRTCLFSKNEHSLRDALRSGMNESEIIRFIRDVVMQKEISHNINSPAFVQPARTMSLIGG